MEIIKTTIEDLIIIKPRVFEDARGFFIESYSELKFNEAGDLTGYLFGLYLQFLEKLKLSIF